MTTRTLELQHRAEEITRFNEAFHSLLQEIEIPVKAEHTLAIVMEEVVLNVAHHATPQVDLPFTVTMSVEPGRFTASVQDYGEPFDPLAREEPDITLPIEDRPIGGLGILMTRKMMTSVDYKREQDCNCLDLELRW